MEAIETFRYKLSRGHVCIGASITYTDPLVTDALGHSADFFWIDLEHSAMSPEALSGHLLAARSRAVPALVRVPSSETSWIKPVLDAGAPGIIVPQVKSVEEVRRVVADCRYAPMGHRGFGPRVPADYGRKGDKEYVEWANRNVFVAVQIETLKALEAIDEIVQVKGLDSVVIGPWDLSSALGVLGEVEHPKVVEAIVSIAAKAKAAGIHVGAGMPGDPDYACTMAGRGVQWLQVGSDFSYLIRSFHMIASAIQSGLIAAPDAGRTDRKKENQ